MIKVKVDPIVLTSIRKAFPKANSAKNALDKYIALFEEMLNESVLYRIMPYNPSLNVYSISLFKLNEKSPRIGSDKIRLHKWLVDNNLSLFETEQLGAIGGINKGSSIIKPSSLVTLIEVFESIDPETAFKKYHPNLENFAQQINDYDRCEIDVESLNNFVNLLNQIKKPTKKDRTALEQAMHIAAAATYKKNVYYQKRKHSDFGRTYYEGLSVQNVRKDVREAMLGDCFEYDMQSSVIAWKLGYAQAIIDADPSLNGKSVQDVFPQCYQYWEDKSVLIDAIRANVFTGNYYTDKKQIKLVKQAMTALNFGARRTSHSYFNSEGIYCKQAIGTIFSDYDECEDFLNSDIVIEFIEEQKLLNTTIINPTNQSALLAKPFLLSNNNRLKRNKALAYLYQNEETRVMDIVRQHAKKHNLSILANIHDAIVLKQKINDQVIKNIYADILTQTGNSFWLLNETALKRTP